MKTAPLQCPTFNLPQLIAVFRSFSKQLYKAGPTGTPPLLDTIDTYTEYLKLKSEVQKILTYLFVSLV